MEATFTIKILGARAGTFDGTNNVIKQIDWALVGDLEGQSFELPQSITLPDPLGEITPLDSLTEDDFKRWITDNSTDMMAIKDHIQQVLNVKVVKASVEPIQLPWMTIETIPDMSSTNDDVETGGI